MELLVIASTLCFCLCTLTNPSSSRQLHLHPSPQQAAPPKELLPTQLPKIQIPMKSLEVSDHKHIHHTVLDREIGNGDSVKQYKAQDHTHNSDTSRAHSDRNSTKAKRREKERLQAYLLQLSRMDYARVRRRRPIHNRGVPAAP